MEKRLVTSAVANKMLKQLREDKEYLIQMEEESSVYIRVAGYDDERPEYSYEDIREKIAAIDDKICQLKHRVNAFNSATQLPGLNMTIDMALIKMAQLGNEKERLDKMRKRLPVARKKRDRFGEQNNLVEYVCVNYDLETVKKDYEKVSDDIREIQLSLDTVNQTVQFEVDI